MGADEKYPVLNRDKLTIPMQMQLTQKRKISEIFAVFLKCRLNSKYFERKCDPHRCCISEIKDSENVVR